MFYVCRGFVAKALLGLGAATISSLVEKISTSKVGWLGQRTEGRTILGRNKEGNMEGPSSLTASPSIL